MDYPKVDRRGFMKMGAAALAAGPLVGARGAAGAARATAAAGGGSFKPPAYVPRKGLGKPQLPATDILTAGYLEPPDPFNAYKGKPLKGGSVTYFGINVGTPIPPRGQNKWWQAIESAVGAQINSNLIAGSGYQEKAQALIATNDYPDLFQITGPTAFPQLEQLLEAKFVDISEYVAGDKIKQYPNLANIPTELWLNNEVNGRIWGCPTPRPLQNNAPLIYRKDLAQKAGVSLPKNSKDFMAWAKALTKPGQWALAGDNDGSPYMYDWFMQVWGVPNNWSVGKNGKFTSWMEEPQVKDVLDFIVSLRKAGVFAPYATETELKDQLAAGTVVTYEDTFTGLPGEVTSTATANPSAPVDAVDVIIPFGHDGGKAVSWNAPGDNSLACGFPKASKLSVEARLRLCDWHASPTFSDQANLLTYGVKGVHYTVVNGVITPTAEGKSESAGIILNYVDSPPFVYYNTSSALGQWTTKTEYNGSVQASKIGVDDPTVRLYSPTYLDKGETLSTNMTDTIRSIVTGRQPVSYWDTFVKQWRAQGGDQMRSEYEKAYKGGKKKS